VTVPLLIMHGEADPAISIRYGERMFAMAMSPNNLFVFQAVTKIWMISVLSRPCGDL
jgi:fermentation-respiration switch protein FrsA (DUF1100 family)